ncbi:protein psp1 [Anaeramoeba flamelloides]|uniref:Protein psp1 n=1 Tax=Anaeramoeba flamelloides TaxID=1746091 RepID=A0ABQ8XHB2_9EUKA|nr:protein psp1 [Anaeramoeba flamelloides]
MMNNKNKTSVNNNTTNNEFRGVQSIGFNDENWGFNNSPQFSNNEKTNRNRFLNTNPKTNTNTNTNRDTLDSVNILIQPKKNNVRNEIRGRSPNNTSLNKTINQFFSRSLGSGRSNLRSRSNSPSLTPLLSVSQEEKKNMQNSFHNLTLNKKNNSPNLNSFSTSFDLGTKNFDSKNIVAKSNNRINLKQKTNENFNFHNENSFKINKLPISNSLPNKSNFSTGTNSKSNSPKEDFLSQLNNTEITKKQNGNNNSYLPTTFDQYPNRFETSKKPDFMNFNQTMRRGTTTNNKGRNHRSQLMKKTNNNRNRINLFKTLDQDINLDNDMDENIDIVNNNNTNNNNKLNMRNTININNIPKYWRVAFKGGRNEIYKLSLGIQVNNGDFVIVEADRGEDLGKTVESVQENDLQNGNGTYKNKSIFRCATIEEINDLTVKMEEELQALQICRKKVLQRELLMNHKYSSDENGSENN